MRRSLLAVLLTLLGVLVWADRIDVVTTKDGNVFKGVIVENKIREYVRLEIVGGSILKISYDNIESLEIENSTESEQSIPAPEEPRQDPTIRHPNSVEPKDGARFRMGLEAGLLPFGQLTLAALSDSYTGDAATAFSVTAFFDYSMTPYLGVGLVPRLVFNVKGRLGTSAATQIDLRARATARVQPAAGMQLNLSVAPGYSIIVVPGLLTDIPMPSGPVLAISGGASFDIGPAAFLVIDLGYQWGFQGWVVEGIRVDFSDNYLDVGMGIGMKL